MNVMLREANCEHCAGYRRYVVAEIGGGGGGYGMIVIKIDVYH